MVFPLLIPLIVLGGSAIATYLWADDATEWTVGKLTGGEKIPLNNDGTLDDDNDDFTGSDGLDLPGGADWWQKFIDWFNGLWDGVGAWWDGVTGWFDSNWWWLAIVLGFVLCIWLFRGSLLSGGRDSGGVTIVNKIPGGRK